MQFLAPLFWIGAVAVAVPIILHLTRKASKRPILFPSLMFLRRLPVVEVRRRRLKHPLLLALRCLGILLLVAAFSRPLIDALWTGALVPGMQTSTVFLVDVSMSMSRETVWERARDVLVDRINEMKAGDEAMIVGFASVGRGYSTWEPGRARLLEIVQGRLEPTFEPTSYGGGLSIAVDSFEESRNPLREIVLITDLQSSGLNHSGFEDIQIPLNIALVIEDVGEDSDNLFLDEVRVDREVYGETYPFGLIARVVSGSPTPEPGEADIQEGEVRLFLGDELIDSRRFQIGKSGSSTVNFKPFDLPEGFTRGRLVVDPADSLAQDDNFYFVLERSTPFGVLLVSERGSENPYFTKALEVGKNLPFRTRGVSTTGAINTELDGLVVLDDFGERPDQSVARFLENGGGVVVCLGSRFSPSRFGSPDWFPVRITEKRFARSSRDPFVSITETLEEHPIFNPFQKTRDNALTGIQFFGYWGMEPVDGSLVLARFGNGDPALVEAPYGKGKVLVFASSLGRVWSDFPMRSAYVPFWQQVVQYASQQKQKSASLTVSHVLSVEDFFSDAESDEERRWDVLDPTGRRVLGLGQEAPEFLSLDRPGHYEVRRNRGTDWIAVNVDRTESDLSRLEEGELLSAIKSLQKQDQQAKNFASISNETDGQEFWRVTLLLAGLVFLLEAFLANRIARRSSRFNGARTRTTAA